MMIAKDLFVCLATNCVINLGKYWSCWWNYWWKYLVTAIATVRAHVRASSWCLQAAHPHFGKIVPTLIAALRLCLSFFNDTKNVIKMPRKFYLMWCLLFVKMLALKCTYLTSNLRQNESSDQPFSITFFRSRASSITLKEFLKKMPIRCTFMARILINRLESPPCAFGGITPWYTQKQRARFLKFDLILPPEKKVEFLHL